MGCLRFDDERPDSRYTPPRRPPAPAAWQEPLSGWDSASPAPQAGEHHHWTPAAPAAPCTSGKVRGSISVLAPLRDVAVAPAPAPAPDHPTPLDALRGRLGQVIAGWVAEAKAFQQERQTKGYTDFRDRHHRGDVPRPAPLLLAGQPGLGKSTMVAAAVVAAQLTSASITGSNDAVEGTQKLFRDAGGWVDPHSPRRALTEAELEAGEPSKTRGGACGQKGAVDTLSRDRHSAAGSACPTCPSDLLRRYLEAKTPEEKAVLGERMDAWAKAHPNAADPYTVFPCGYYSALEKLQRRTHIVMNAQAWGPAHYDQDVTFGEVDRAVHWDECPDMLAEGKIRATHATHWAAALDAHLAWLDERHTADAATVEREDRMSATAKRTDDWLSQVKDARERLAEAEFLEPAMPHILGAQHELCQAHPDRAKLAAHFEALAAIAKKARTKTSAAAATWEPANLAWVGGNAEVDAALRAILDLEFALKHGSWMVTDAVTDKHGKLVRPSEIRFASPTQMGTELVKGKRPLLGTDGTPRLAMRAAIEALGGHIESLWLPVDDETLRVVRHAGWQATRGKTKSLQRKLAAAWRIAQIARDQFKETGRRPAILTQKPWALLIVERGWWPEELVGWWEADDVAHNKWKGRDIIIAGLPLTAPDDTAMHYLMDRAFALWAGAPAADWPEWNGKWIKGEGPADPQIRAWYLDWLAGRLVQAIGRTRYLDYPGRTVTLLGRAVDLSAYGITVHEVDEPASGDVTAADSDALRNAARLADTVDAWCAVVADGAKPTKRAVVKRGGVERLWSTVRDRVKAGEDPRAIAEAAHAELASLRASTGCKVTVERITTRTGATRRVWRITVHEVARAANVTRVEFGRRAPAKRQRAGKPARALARGP